MKTKTEKYSIAVFISGRGSNLANLLKACSEESYPAKVECVISNNAQAQGLKIAESYQVPTFTVENGFENKAHGILGEFNIKLICLAGFMKIISADFIKRWDRKIINIHPSLLPAFKGLKAQAQALKAGVKISGCTVHYVDSKIDHGDIIMQAAVPVLPDDTSQTLSDRILLAEHKCYPVALQSVLMPSLSLKDSLFMSCQS